MAEAQAGDEEYMQQLILRYGGKLPDGDNAPRLREYTLPVDKLSKIVEELRGIKTVLIKANSKKGATIPEPERELRPRNALTRVAQKVRLAKHAALASRIVRKDPTESSD
jgi:hypothetical protein